MEPLQISKSFMRESQTQFPKDKSLLSLYISKAFVLAFDPASSFFVFRFFFFLISWACANKLYLEMLILSEGLETNLFSECLLSPYYVPSSIVGIWDNSTKQKRQNVLPL